MSLNFRFLLISLLLALTISCNNRVTDFMEPPPPMDEPKQPVQYLALGDSYTIGQSVVASVRYPIQLTNMLNLDTMLLDTTLIIAKTGWRTDDLQRGIDNASLKDTFDLVSLLIGVNNQFQNRPIEQYETEFAELLNQAVALAGGRSNRVFVLSIPDYGYTPFGQSNQEKISTGIDQYNEINKRITEDLNISWFDITPISRNGISNPNLVAADGLHPSGEMYRQWVELIRAEVLSKLIP